jgi:hypothetical protein
MRFNEYLEEDKRWKDEIFELLLEKIQPLPKGWTEKSVKKFAKSLTGKTATEKGFFDLCLDKMRKHMDDPEGFCAYVKDVAFKSTYWRGKGKSEKEAKGMSKKTKNVEVKKK